MQIDWQPIETHHRDNRKVLLYMKGAHIRSARWNVGWGCWEASDNDDVLNPTHWAPIQSALPKDAR
jgi:hypothetical protein